MPCSSRSFFSRFAYISPHALHSECSPVGPLRHSGVLEVPHCEHTRLRGLRGLERLPVDERAAVDECAALLLLLLLVLVLVLVPVLKLMLELELPSAPWALML